VSNKKTTKQYIDDTAKQAAREVLNLQRQQRNVNLYRATERLLRAYPKLKRMHDHPEEYGFLPVGKSKSISVAPPPGSGVRDPIEALEEHIDSRAASYDRTIGRYNEINAVVQMFIGQPEFVVIRMVYWNEDAYGHDRGDAAKRLSFEEIQEELCAAGIVRNVKTIRMWRTKLVQDMTVLLFGVDGAVSVESREPKQGQPEEGGADGQLCGPQ